MKTSHSSHASLIYNENIKWNRDKKGLARIMVCRNSCFCPSTRPIIPVAVGNKTGLILFMHGKSILADTHLLCLADSCSLFNYFHQEFFFSGTFSFGHSLILWFDNSTLFKVSHHIFHFLIFRPPCLTFECLQWSHCSEVISSGSSGSQLEVSQSQPLRKLLNIWLISTSFFACFRMKTLFSAADIDLFGYLLILNIL